VDELGGYCLYVFLGAVEAAENEAMSEGSLSSLENQGSEKTREGEQVKILYRRRVQQRTSMKTRREKDHHLRVQFETNSNRPRRRGEGERQGVQCNKSVGARREWEGAVILESRLVYQE
jgi:hypothetical protein